MIQNLYDLIHDETALWDYLKESLYFYFEGVDEDIVFDLEIPSSSSKSEIQGQSIKKSK